MKIEEKIKIDSSKVVTMSDGFPEKPCYDYFYVDPITFEQWVYRNDTWWTAENWVDR